MTIAYQLQEIRPRTRQSTFLPVTPLVEINPQQHLMAAIKQSSVSYVIRIMIEKDADKQHRKLLLSSLASNLLSVTSSSVSLLPIKAHSQTTCHEGHL